jgi:exo-beta-1,3-glucanase (GH17 family)
VTADELVGFIGSATTQLRAAGFTGIVSTAETVSAYQNNPEICGAVDGYVHANIHGYFDPSCTSSEAGSFVVSQQNLVESICNLPCIISETGWPSGGGNDGAAVASPQDQITAITSIYQATNGAATFFSYRDDPWKTPGVEQHWGMSLFSNCF